MIFVKFLMYVPFRFFPIVSYFDLYIDIISYWYLKIIDSLP